MGNPLASLFGSGGQPQASNNKLNNLSGLISQFQEFKNNFRGDPEQIVQELRRSGKMSEAQFQQLKGLASQLQNVMR